MSRFVTVCLMLGTMLVSAVAAYAHGVALDYTVDDASGAITVRAAFDTGEPLGEAQVAVFAPNDLVTPWLTGAADADGAFAFTPDYTIEGVWDVQVRKAGHGGLLHLTLDASMAATGSALTAGAAPPAAPGNGFTPAQVVIMSASIIWGCVGTALYFAGRRRAEAH